MDLEASEVEFALRFLLEPKGAGQEVRTETRRPMDRLFRGRQPKGGTRLFQRSGGAPDLSWCAGSAMGWGVPGCSSKSAEQD
jgi:hypothetical protein